ncbi:hypothetical protein SAMN02746000_01602 [Paracoccus sp. J56]|nr:hypothetical protein SAMN02746000_01602 [Paracoccus sp. J56]
MTLRMRRLFLGRSAYRKRRLGDATRVLPVLFALLTLLPPMWLPQYFSFARGAVWLAAGWALTIAVTAGLHRAIARSRTEDEDDA